jgi:hypothetical protein
MEKNTITITKPKNVKFDFQDQQIVLQPYISLVEMTGLINTYIETLFQNDEYVSNHQSAEWGLILKLTNDLTNLRIIEADTNVNLEDLMDAGLWQEIENRIINHWELRRSIDDAVANILEQKRLDKSLGSVVEGISNKLFLFLEKISAMDISQEGLTKLVSEFKTEATNFAEKYGGPEPKKRTKKSEQKAE